MDNNELTQRIAELPLEDEHIVHIYPSDLARMEGSETTATVFSVAVGCPDTGERSVPLYTADQVRAAQAPLIERIQELEAALKHAQEMTAVEAVVAVKWQRKSAELKKQNAELLKVLRIALPCAEIDAALASSQQQKGGV